MRYLLLPDAIRSFWANFSSLGAFSSVSASPLAVSPSATISVSVRAMVCLPVRSLVLLLLGLHFEHADDLAQLADLGFQGHQALVQDRVVLGDGGGDHLHLGVGGAGLDTASPLGTTGGAQTDRVDLVPAADRFRGQV